MFIPQSWGSRVPWGVQSFSAVKRALLGSGGAKKLVLQERTGTTRGKELEVWVKDGQR